MPVPRIVPIVVRARMALGWTQRELGENLGGSHRTATRWESGAAHFDVGTAAKLAAHVYSRDPGIAAELAAAIGQTLVSLGVEAPPPPPLPPAPVHVAIPAPAARAARPTQEVVRDLLDAIVCSVADAQDVAPRMVRPLVLLTLRRALEVGLDVESALKAGLLAEPAATAGARETV